MDWIIAERRDGFGALYDWEPVAMAASSAVAGRIAATESATRYRLQVAWRWTDESFLAMPSAYWDGERIPMLGDAALTGRVYGVRL